MEGVPQRDQRVAGRRRAPRVTIPTTRFCESVGLRLSLPTRSSVTEPVVSSKYFSEIKSAAASEITRAMRPDVEDGLCFYNMDAFGWITRGEQVCGSRVEKIPPTSPWARGTSGTPPGAGQREGEKRRPSGGSGRNRRTFSKTDHVARFTEADDARRMWARARQGVDSNPNTIRAEID